MIPMEIMADGFWLKAGLVVGLLVAQAALWAWVGSQAKRFLEWWPF